MDVTIVSVIALFTLIYGAFSNRLRNSIITAPLAFMVLGTICGKLGFDLIDVQLDNPIIIGLAELALVVVLFTDAARIDLKLLYREHNLPIRLLLVGLPTTIVFGSLIAFGLMPSLGIFGAAVLATVVAPTDAALAHAVVSKRIVPSRIRQAISVESGLNDGLVVPVLLVFLCYAEAMAHEESAGYWLAFATKQIAFGPLAGITIALVAGKCLERAKQLSSINHTFFQLSAIALALLAYGTAELVGGNGFIAAFTAGIVVGNVSPIVCETLFDFVETEGQLFSIAMFFVFGALLLPQAFAESLPPGVFLFPILSLTVIRIVPALISMTGTNLKFSSRLFISWFGPRGIASIVFLLVILERTGIAGTELLIPAAVLTVFLSIVFHGITANPATLWYASHLQNKYQYSELADNEHREIQEFPFWRPYDAVD